MARTDPRNRNARQLGVTPCRHAPPRLTDPRGNQITSQHPTCRPRYRPPARRLHQNKVARIPRVPALQDARTGLSFYSPINPPGVQLFLSDSASSFLVITDGPLFPSVLSHNPPPSRLAANGYVSSKISSPGERRAACVILRGMPNPIIYLRADGSFQATNSYIVVLERQGIPDNVTTAGGQGENRNNPLSDAKIASSSADMRTASRPSTPPHRSTHTETGADAQAIEAAISLSPKEGAGSNGQAGTNINEGVIEGRFSFKGLG